MTLAEWIFVLIWCAVVVSIPACWQLSKDRWASRLARDSQQNSLRWRDDR